MYICLCININIAIICVMLSTCILMLKYVLYAYTIFCNSIYTVFIYQKYNIQHTIYYQYTGVYIYIYNV